MNQCNFIQRFIKFRFFILSLLIFYKVTETAPTEPKIFFDSLEHSLREDYRICTGDSTQQPIDKLFLWKKQTDVQLESDSFKIISQFFFKETGLSPFDVKPCEIILWNQNYKKSSLDANQLLSQDIAARQKRIEDSLSIEMAIKKAKVSTLDFAGIPFGITKDIFTKMITRTFRDGFNDEGSSIQYEKVSIDDIKVRAAFHFDKNGYYRMYELESEGGPLDSLNTKVRLESAMLASIIEVKSGSAPDHIFRIGRFDITQGRLAVEQSWNLESVSAFVGFATYKYHYYGKVVVVARKVFPIMDDS